MTSLNLLSQQKAHSDQEAEVSVQRTFIVREDLESVLRN